MQLTGKVVASYYCGRSVALKTYPAADTAHFKCWGSGSRNEEAVRRRLGRLVPELVHWQADDHAELAWLQWIDGEPPRATEQFFLNAGLTLGRIHTRRGSYWGSLDGRWRFPTCRDALRSRLAAATNLLATGEPVLAARIRAWTDTALDELAGLGPPVLVHGDFGGGADTPWLGRARELVGAV